RPSSLAEGPKLAGATFTCTGAPAMRRPDLSNAYARNSACCCARSVSVTCSSFTRSTGTMTWTVRSRFLDGGVRLGSVSDADGGSDARNVVRPARCAMTTAALFPVSRADPRPEPGACSVATELSSIDQAGTGSYSAPKHRSWWQCVSSTETVSDSPTTSQRA